MFKLYIITATYIVLSTLSKLALTLRYLSKFKTSYISEYVPCFNDDKIELHTRPLSVCDEIHGDFVLSSCIWNVFAADLLACHRAVSPATGFEKREIKRNLTRAQANKS